ncbi:hypothetical protein EXN22_17785 [Pseudomonas tructae]|uniref:Uncharacterized protein n=1 Tax=Pseudomonas tructae TaxID=2518644 RepID=A0A411MR16_9PSED|nr:hypothetical protein [Pseudomonas tructae]QBF29120.1 hypothetical protein EXN22_17785 [Pseudomonas tructae]
MAVQYGFRTRNASGVTTLDTSISTIRSLTMRQVTCNGSFEQNFAIPEITAGSFVVVDTLRFDSTNTTWSPQAWYSPGNLLIRRGESSTWQVSILSTDAGPTAADAYGIRTTNDLIRTQIDSSNRALNVLHKGSFTFYGYQNPTPPGWINGFDFPVPITTHERPFVFLNTPDGGFFYYFSVLGSPGNWTGWRVGRFDNPNYTGIDWKEQVVVNWFVASYSPGVIPQGSHGARVRDAQGVEIFSTTNDIAQMKSQPFSNSFAAGGTSIPGTGYYYASSQMAWTNNFSDYFLANALLSCVYINFGTSSPYRFNAAGWFKGNRSILQAWTDNPSGISAVYPNGRTLFAGRPSLI